MIGGRLLRLLAITTVAAIAAQAQSAAAAEPDGAPAVKPVDADIAYAGRFMLAAASIDRNRTGTSAAPSNLADLGLVDFRAINDRFEEKLGILLAATGTHVVVAFRDAANDANERLDRDAEPVMAAGRKIVHGAWLAAAAKAYNNEVRPYLMRHGVGRDIVLTGHGVGGVMAAYTAWILEGDKSLMNRPVRLATFGAPRYTDDPNFFDLERDIYVYTVEAATADRCPDPAIYAWQKALHRKSAYADAYSVLAGKRGQRAFLAVARNRIGDNAWHGRCLTDRETAAAAHGADAYFELSQAKTCAHIPLQTDCKSTRSYID